MQDFGLSGMRTGVIISRNISVINTMTTLAYLEAVPALIQHKLSALIRDKGRSKRHALSVIYA